MDADVIIVGGGLSGASTALQLGRRGVRVIVVEKSAFPRDKPCGEGLLPHGAHHLASLGFPSLLADLGAQPFRGILYRAHGARAVGDFACGATGFGVRRRLLDQAMQSAAAALPDVELVRGKVAEVQEYDDGVAVQLSDGPTLRASFLVGADGPRSRVRHSLGLDGGTPKSGRYAIRQHFELAADVALPDRVEVNACEGFEMYLTPVSDGVVGLAALCELRTIRGLDGSADLKLQTLLTRAPAALRARLHGAKPCGPAMACGPLRVKARRVHGRRTLLVGDAAGYVDAITGEGMSLALGTSRFASAALHAVLRDGQSTSSAFGRYAKERARIFRDHAWLTHGLVFLARHPVLARRAIARLGKEPMLFTRLLEVNDGQKSIFSLGVGDGLKLAIGSSHQASDDDEVGEPARLSGKKRGLPPMASA